MHKLTPIFLVLAAFFLMALAAGISYNRARTNSTPSTAVHVVSLLGDHASPDLLTIKIGESVQFVSADQVTHNLSESFNSASPTTLGAFQPSEGYLIKLNQAGSYDFTDLLHPKINLKVVVYDPAK